MTKDITQLGNFSPLERLDLLQSSKFQVNMLSLCPLSDTVYVSEYDNNQIIDELRKIIYAMNVLDELFSKLTDFKRHIYILGDGTIFNFLNRSKLSEGIYLNNKSCLLEMLCMLGLTYRFNAAKKFGYEETGIMQVRLNG